MSLKISGVTQLKNFFLQCARKPSGLEGRRGSVRNRIELTAPHFYLWK